MLCDACSVSRSFHSSFQVQVALSSCFQKYRALQGTNPPTIGAHFQVSTKMHLFNAFVVAVAIASSFVGAQNDDENEEAAGKCSIACAFSAGSELVSAANA
jgi:hypothetical protein